MGTHDNLIARLRSEAETDDYANEWPQPDVTMTWAEWADTAGLIKEAADALAALTARAQVDDAALRTLASEYCRAPETDDAGTHVKDCLSCYTLRDFARAVLARYATVPQK